MARRSLWDRPEVPALLRRYFGPDMDQPIEFWPREKLRAYQTEAVAEQLEHVYQNNPFYRHKFDTARVKPADFRTLEDLGCFPFTAKDELRGDPWILLSIPKEEVCLAHTSTGTTGGVWSYILYSRADVFVRDVAPFMHVLMPVHAGDVVINALPYEMSSSGQSFQRSLQEGTGALVVPVGKGGFYADPYKTIGIMADLKADVLITTPPYAMLLSEVAEDMKLSPGADIKLRFMWLTGEGCSPAYRRRLEECWQCPGLVFYGSMECGSMGIECSVKNGSHVCEGHVYLEVVDPQTGQPQPAGQVGEVVCTVLQRRASPLVRFRTQDLAFLDPSPCPCGTRFPKLHLRGRMADQVSLEDENRRGPAISPFLIEDALYSQPAMGNNYQVYTADAKLVVEAEARPGAADLEKTSDCIVDMLRQRGLTAEVRWVEHIPRLGGKTRRIRPLADREEIMNSPSLLRRSRS